MTLLADQILALKAVAALFLLNRKCHILCFHDDKLLHIIVHNFIFT